MAGGDADEGLDAYSEDALAVAVDDVHGLVEVHAHEELRDLHAVDLLRKALGELGDPLPIEVLRTQGAEGQVQAAHEGGKSSVVDRGAEQRHFYRLQGDCGVPFLVFRTGSELKGLDQLHVGTNQGTLALDHPGQEDRVGVLGLRVLVQLIGEDKHAFRQVYIGVAPGSGVGGVAFQIIYLILVPRVRKNTDDFRRRVLGPDYHTAGLHVAVVRVVELRKELTQGATPVVPHDDYMFLAGVLCVVFGVILHQLRNLGKLVSDDEDHEENDDHSDHARNRHLWVDVSVAQSARGDDHVIKGRQEVEIAACRIGIGPRHQVVE